MHQFAENDNAGTGFGPETIYKIWYLTLHLRLGNDMAIWIYTHFFDQRPVCGRSLFVILPSPARLMWQLIQGVLAPPTHWGFTMNDFLQQLRSGAKRFDKSRKSYDGNHYRGTDRNANRDRKNPAQRRNYDQNQLHNIKKIIEALAEGQKSLTSYAQRQAAATERVADALEEISARMKPGNTEGAARPQEKEIVPPQADEAVPPQAGEAAPPRVKDAVPPRTKEDALPQIGEPDSQAAPTPEQAGPASPANRNAERKAVATIIRNMRNDGKDFDEIARRLQTQKIPTLSGKGAWRVQVVSRLYNQEAGEHR
jgi:hypothetical protein